MPRTAALFLAFEQGSYRRVLDAENETKAALELARKDLS